MIVTTAVGASVLTAFTSTILGAGVFVLSLITIYLRGYLVPGTPTLTKRYVPNRILRWFDKDATTSVDDKIIDINPEQMLLNASAIELCQGGTDFFLTAEFRKMWRDSIHTARMHDSTEAALEVALAIPSGNDRTRVNQQGDAFIAYSDDTVIGQWSSQAAVAADIAAATELSQRSSDWPTFTPAEGARVLMSLRIFIENCPECDSSVQIEKEVVESCCRSYDVIASACQDCGVRLFEMEWDTASADNDHV